MVPDSALNLAAARDGANRRAAPEQPVGWVRTMTEDKIIKETAKALGLSSLLPEVYNDLLSPAARELGEGLATIAKAVKISLAPIEATVWGYEKIREWLSVRVTCILADRKATDITAPPLSVSGPLTLQMVFSSGEPDLREMYANLLASAMDIRTASGAHPSFVTLIQQLTADEAKIISYIALLGKDWPGWQGQVDAASGSEKDLWEKMTRLCTNAKIAHSEKAEIYIENLLRLRLLRHDTSSEAQYQPEGGDDYGTWGPHIITDEYEFIELTAYGRAFISACVPDSSTQP